MGLRWQERLRQMALAGGVLTTGCGGLGFPCGNANPDPCVCDRPSSSSAAAEACSAETTCQKAGGVWQPGTGEWGTGGRCEHDSGTMSPDGSGNDDDGGSRG
jgi:hypothetical protein